MLAQPRGVERALGPKCPWERPLPLGLDQTTRCRVQPRTPPRQPPTFVDDQPSGHRDHSQQLTDQDPLPATNARAYREVPVALEVGRVATHPRRTLNQ